MSTEHTLYEEGRQELLANESSSQLQFVMIRDGHVAFTDFMTPLDALDVALKLAKVASYNVDEVVMREHLRQSEDWAYLRPLFDLRTHTPPRPRYVPDDHSVYPQEAHGYQGGL